jgi:regulator of sigma E protease
MSADNRGEQQQPPAGSWLFRHGVYPLLFAAILVYLIHYLGANTVWAIAWVAAGLGLVVFVHELGHFLVAKWCDVHVETFSIGFGPALPGCRFRRGETTYKIGVFPLGGYVKMVGEGAEGDEGDEDPRSFKNKSVWQRMAIISAGVTMNLILAFAFFVFVFRTHGVERAPGVIDRIDSGGPAWQARARTGDVIEWIDGRGPFPSFDQLMPVVMNSRAGEKLRFVFGPPNAPEPDMVHTEVQPRRHQDDLRPVIGISPPMQLQLLSTDKLAKDHPFPYLLSSAAAAADPPFECDDVIIATTDPEDPKKIKPLPRDPRNPNDLDFFEFERRLVLLAGKEMTIRVHRSGHSEPIDIRVPAANYVTFGMRMRMGKIAALREGSSAKTAGIQEGDIIDSVEVRDAKGHVKRFGSFAGKGPTPEGITQRSLDPLRLPTELRQWAETVQGAKTVSLSLLRTNPPPADFNPNNHQERQRVVVDITWDDSWKFNQEMPLNLYSPLSIPELGIAYHVETTVEAVAANSPALAATVLKPATIKLSKDDVITRQGHAVSAKEGESLQLEEGDTINIKPGDIIKAVKESGSEGGSRGDWIPLQSDQWAGVFYSRQFAESKVMKFRLDRDGLEVALTAQPDASWPLADRGLLLQANRFLQKASSIGQALSMGFDETYAFIDQIFGNLRGVATRRLSPRLFAGPFRIVELALKLAGRNIYEFLTFLGVISVNLAVINFMPIPVLDGGHMAFLIYEKLRGQPAPEGVRIIATYVGLALIVCLMVAVFYLDLSHWL